MSFSANYPTSRPALNLNFARSKVLDPRITFTRASTATYYDGVTTAKAEENLLPQSQDFTNATYWATNTASVSYTANTTAAPDGTMTADTMTAAVGTGTRFGSGTGIYGITSGLVYTASLFVQAGTDTVVQLLFPTGQFGSDAYANFDLSAGTVGSVGASATATISSAGGTWYRCSITATATASSTASIGMGFVFTGNNSSAARLPSITTAGTETLILWGAQLEQRDAVTSYTATTTQQITNYIPVLLTAATNAPRFDHNPTTGESLGLLIEEQRTNLILRSEEFDNASWTKTASSITANTVIAPDGTLTADLVINQGVVTSLLQQQVSVAASSTTDYYVTIYAKKGTATYFTFNCYYVGNEEYNVNFNFDTQVVTGAPSSDFFMESVGNGWYRCGFRILRDSTGTQTAILFRMWESGRGVSSGNTYFWGAQLEVGAFPTSYIPTVASQITRSADAASMTGTNFSSWYNQGEGTLFTEFAWVGLRSVAGQRILVVDNGTTTNYWGMVGTSTNAMQNPVVVNGVTEAANGTPATTYSVNTYYKQTVAIAVNNTVAAINGAAGTTDTVALVPTVNTLRLCASSAGVGENIRIRRIAYYPLRLTNAQLQALTS